VPSKLFILTGPHGAGKASLIEPLIKLGINYVPLYTTNADFKDTDPSRNIQKTVTAQEFNKHTYIASFTYLGAYYGIRKKDMTDALREHPINLAILDGNGVKQMRRLLRDNMVSIYLMTDYVCLIEHLLQIGYTNVEIKDLLQYYEKNHVFNGWKDADFVVKTTRGMQIALKQVLSIMGLTEMLPPEKLKNLIR